MVSQVMQPQPSQYEPGRVEAAQEVSHHHFGFGPPRRRPTSSPYAVTTPTDPEMVKLFGDVPNEDFLTPYTHPVHADTGERLNWMRSTASDLILNSRRVAGTSTAGSTDAIRRG